MTNTRLRDWDTRLTKMVPEELWRPFDWTTSNCGHLMGASIRACLGDDHPALDILRVFSDEQAVKDFVHTPGSLAKYLGGFFPELATPLLAQRGDLVVVVGNDGGECGCVLLDGQIVGKTSTPNKTGRYSFRMPITKGKVAFRL